MTRRHRILRVVTRDDELTPDPSLDPDPDQGPDRGRTLRVGSLIVLGLAAVEVLIMMGPFAGLFYARSSFGFLFETLAKSPWTAWLNGFFLNHSVITHSTFLELQREIGEWMLLGGLAGFAICAMRVYRRKAAGGGVVDQSFYRFVRHPQYLFLGIAGWGLLAGWPRFLLLGIWVTMLFLYAGLSRYEELQLEQRYGDDYARFAASRGAFLPGSPVRRLFEATLGRIRPRPLGWTAAYLVCLAAAFTLAFALRGHTLASSAHLALPDKNMLVVSVWPESDQWMTRVIEAALTNDILERIDSASQGRPLVATILTPRYGMKDMYYRKPPLQRDRAPAAPSASAGFPSIYRSFMGRDPSTSDDPVEVVVSYAASAYRPDLSLEDVLDPGVRLIPLAVLSVDPRSGIASGFFVPLPQNAWGAQVVMPIF